jgi:hypothetical protein
MWKLLTVNNKFNLAVNTSRIYSTLDATNIGVGALIIDGGVDIGKSLNVHGNLYSSNFAISSTDESTDISTGSIILAGGAGISGNLNIGGIEKIFNITGSTSTNTGALLVNGGVGVGENLNIGGNEKITGTLTVFDSASIYDTLNCLDTTESSDITSGSIIVNGGIGIAKNVNTGGKLHVFDTTESIDITTGSVIIDGGLAIAKNLNIGVDVHIGGTLHCPNLVYEDVQYVTSTVDSTTTDTGALIVAGGAGISKNLNIGGVVKCLSTDNSINITTGSLVVSGGAGFANDVYIGGTLHGGNIPIFDNSAVLNLSNTTGSTSTDTGCLTVAGGAGFASDVYIGGTIHATSGIPPAFDPSAILAITNTTGSTSTNTGCLTVAGGAGFASDVYIGGTLHGGNIPIFDNSAVLNISNTTVSTSTNTGAIIVSGGIGCGDGLYATSLHSTNILNNSLLWGSSSTGLIDNSTNYIIDNSDPNASKLKIVSPNSSKITQIATDQAYNISQLYSTAATTEIWGNAQKCASLNDTATHLYGTNETTSISTGALLIDGGAAIAKTLYVNTAINSVGGYYKGKTIADASWWRLYRIPTHNNDHIDFSIINKVNNTYDLGKTNFYTASTFGADMVTKYDKSAPVDTRICTFNNGSILSTYTEVDVEDVTFSITQITTNWQSFTAVSGYKMTRFAVRFSCTLSSINSFEFRIYSGEGTGGTLLDTINVTGYQAVTSPEWLTVNTNSLITLVPNTKYTIWVNLVSQTVPSQYWNNGSSYSGGTNDHGGSPYYFTVTTEVTYVDVYTFGNISDVKINSSGTIQTASNGGSSTWPADYPAGANLVFDSSTTKANSNNEMGALTLWNTTTATNATTGSLTVAGGVGISGNLFGSASTFTSTTQPLSLNYDATNKSTFNVSSSGNMSIDCSGNNINFHNSDIVHVLNTVEASNYTTGSLIVSGGAGFAGGIYTNTNFYIDPTVNLIKETQLLNSVKLTGPNAATLTQIGSFAFYSFVNGSTKEIFASWDCMHEYKLNTDVFPHIHICFNNSAAGTAQFKLTYNITNVDNSFDFTGTALATVSQANDTINPDRHYMLNLGSFTGPSDVGSIINFRLQRLGAADSFPQPVYMCSFGMHWYVDRMGNLT